MASIFKRCKRKNESYWIEYKDHGGKRRTAKGFTDKGLTEELAAKLETEARLRKTGLVDVEQERFAAAKQTPMADQLKAYEASLARHSELHIKMTTGRIRRIVAGCDIGKLADLNAERVETYLRALRQEENLSHRTYNHYLQSINAFCNWCVTTDRLLHNPLKSLERLNPETDVRHPRRALTPDEVRRLVDAARKSGKRVKNLAPELRARAYIFACLTGLRKQELASLTPASFRLEDDPPTVTLAAACSKHRRKDVLPLHPELVSLLRGWLPQLKPTERLFPLLGTKKLGEMVRSDLKRAGIPYRTSEGFADFHAAGRHTYITQLLRSGASLPETRQLARHSDVKMTMRYTHIGIEDQAKAVGNMPSPQASPTAEEAEEPGESAALQMRCNSGGAGSQSQATTGAPGAAETRRNPLRDKVFGKNCHRLSLAGSTAATERQPWAILRNPFGVKAKSFGVDAKN